MTVQETAAFVYNAQKAVPVIVNRHRVDESLSATHAHLLKPHSSSCHSAHSHLFLLL